MGNVLENVQMEDGGGDWRIVLKYMSVIFVTLYLASHISAYSYKLNACRASLIYLANVVGHFVSTTFVA